MACHGVRSPKFQPSLAHLVKLPPSRAFCWQISLLDSTMGHQIEQRFSNWLDVRINWGEFLKADARPSPG